MSEKTRGRPKGTGKTTKGNSVGNKIRRARIKLGLGLEEVASRAGVSLQFVSNIEHGRAPLPFTSVEALSATLDISKKTLALAALKSTNSYKEYERLAG